MSRLRTGRRKKTDDEIIRIQIKEELYSSKKLKNSKTYKTQITDRQAACPNKRDRQATCPTKEKESFCWRNLKKRLSKCPSVGVEDKRREQPWQTKTVKTNNEKSKTKEACDPAGSRI
jgi:hypothetical protein